MKQARMVKNNIYGHFAMVPNVDKSSKSFAKFCFTHMQVMNMTMYQGDVVQNIFPQKQHSHFITSKTTFNLETWFLELMHWTLNIMYSIQNINVWSHNKL